MNKKSRIVICNAQVPFVHGGSEKLVESLHGELKGRGFNVDVVRIPFKWYPAERVITECMLWRMLDLTESNGKEIDILIATKFPSTVVKHPNKRIWLVHQFRQAYDLYGTEIGDLEYSQEDRRLRDTIIDIDKKTIPEAKKIYTISKNVSDRLREFNGIESSPLYPPPSNLGKFYSEDYGDYVLYVGRLDRLKRVDLLIEAFKETKNGVRCKIAGAGEEKEHIEKLVKEAGLSEKVEVLGYVPDEEVLKLYANARAVFYAPYDEDYGYATVEAFLSKRPIITANDSGGVLEFVRDGENGFVVNPEPTEIAERIDRLFGSEKDCRKMGRNGYETVKDISWDRIIENLLG
ncbi:MAG: glycosyltransferase family 4 protein [Thermodesulfobacteriota bacterium]